MALFNFQLKTAQPQKPLMCHQDCNEYETVPKAKEFVKRTTAPWYNSPHNEQTFSLPSLEKYTSYQPNVMHTLLVHILFLF